MPPPHPLPILRNFHSTPTPFATPTSTPMPASAQILDIFDAPTRLGYRPIPSPSYSTPSSLHKPSFMPRPRPLPRPLPPPTVFAGPAYTVASITHRTRSAPQPHTSGMRMSTVELFDGPARIRRVRRTAPKHLWLPMMGMGTVVGAAAYGWRGSSI